jgi:2-oxoglutarate ferredoxin oxidoreductase subunit delta
MNQMGFLFALWTGEETCTGCAICGEICPDIAIRVWK